MKWQEKITKKEMKHLREMGVSTLTEARRNADHQKIVRENGAAEGLPRGIAEPCFDCLIINRKLGLPI